MPQRWITSRGANRVTADATSTTMRSPTSNKSSSTWTDTSWELRVDNTQRAFTGPAITTVRGPGGTDASSCRVDVGDSSVKMYWRTEEVLSLGGNQTIMRAQGGTTRMVIDHNVGFGFYPANGSVTGGVLIQTGSLSPHWSAGAVSLGVSGQLWSAVWSSNGVIQTSDQRRKTPIEALPDALVEAWPKHVRIGRWRWLEDDNGWHAGFIAQDVIAAFEAAGLEWRDWFTVQECAKSGQLSIMMPEVLAIEAEVQRRRLERIERMLGL